MVLCYGTNTIDVTAGHSYTSMQGVFIAYTDLTSCLSHVLKIQYYTIYYVEIDICSEKLYAQICTNVVRFYYML